MASERKKKMKAETYTNMMDDLKNMTDRGPVYALRYATGAGRWVVVVLDYIGRRSMGASVSQAIHNVRLDCRRAARRSNRRKYPTNIWNF